jgi:hypothetical protein
VGIFDYREWNFCERWNEMSSRVGIVHVKGRMHGEMTRGRFPVESLATAWRYFCTGPTYDIFSVLFKGSPAPWGEIGKASGLSIERNASGLGTYELCQPPLPAPDGHLPSINANHAKLEYWADRVQRATRPLVLLDADCLVLEDLAHVFVLPFDVGITFQRRPDCHFNGGVVFVQPTEAAKSFFKLWLQRDQELYQNDTRLREAQNDHRGMNQASLFQLMQRGELAGIRVLEVPCQTHNCIEHYWRLLDKGLTPVVLHIKPRLRRDLETRVVRRGWKTYTVPLRVTHATRICQEYGLGGMPDG